MALIIQKSKSRQLTDMQTRHSILTETGVELHSSEHIILKAVHWSTIGSTYYW